MGKKSTPPSRKPVKRLNGRVRGAVTPKGSGTRREVRSTAPMRRTRSYSAFKNFINKFSRDNPGKLRVEGVSIWRKMSPQEKQPFQRSSTGRLHENPSTNTQVREEELLSLPPITNEDIVPGPSVENNQSRTVNRPTIFGYFLNAIYRAMHLFY
ncbi:uncharacterized protein LOC122626472 [Drosophila teissieri]|uniref:uncharacterized protein LOC122626472 n=1 Tax=Drosophila teissieri TaxID=7243 RepID=UPI001CBA4CE2|nr:uncharacterized protein LOC122626472 [Drosophila teissieri]